MARLEKPPQAEHLNPLLSGLYERELTKHPDLWDFCWPSRYKVAAAESGWYLPIRWDGNSRLCFVGAQPSSRGDFPFPSSRDRLFWDTCVRHGLASDALPREVPFGHVKVCYEGPFATNLVPKRARVREAENLQQWQSSQWVEGFLAKISVVDPILLVAMGNQVFEALRGLPHLNIPIERVTHHGYFARRATLETAIRKLNTELARVRRVYNWLLRQSQTHR